MIIEPVENKLILPPHIEQEKRNRELRHHKLMQKKAKQYFDKRELKEKLKGNSLVCCKCGVRAGTLTKITQTGEYKGVTIRKTEEGYKCQLCL